MNIRYQLISLRDEVLRQYDEMVRLLERYSTISQVLIGFSIALISYSLLYKERLSIELSFIEIPLSIFAYGCLFMALYYGYLAYKIETVPSGPKTGTLINELKGGEDIRIKKINRLMLTNRIIKEYLDKKGSKIRKGFIFYLIGFSVLILIKFINLIL